MKVCQAVDFHLQYHRANSKKITIKTCEFGLRHSIVEGSSEIQQLSFINNLLKL